MDSKKVIEKLSEDSEAEQREINYGRPVRVTPIETINRKQIPSDITPEELVKLIRIENSNPPKTSK